MTTHPVQPAGPSIERDNEGYLKNLSQWSESVAAQIAADEGIVLSDAHWEIINLLRDFYAEHDHSPAMRPFVKWVAQKAGPEKGNSLYLLKLFPESPAKRASKIAGLPKPTNCL
ncbi:MAG TPA: TusE/DsrC/DsvC family sulfur relay protein [Pseudomonadales bacterium]|nr:TusE/DsrC/DsvC family sulfur relay protein [Pseudomonadales bacterium]